MSHPHLTAQECEHYERIVAALLSALMAGRLRFEDRAREPLVMRWDVTNRATRLWCLRTRDRYVTARVWLDAARERTA